MYTTPGGAYDPNEVQLEGNNSGRNIDNRLQSSGIGQLMGVMNGYFDLMSKKEPEVNKAIQQSEKPNLLKEAKNTALENETEILKSIMDDIAGLNKFLNNIILIENKFNKEYMPYKSRQQQARNKYCKNIDRKYSAQPKPKNAGVNTFIDLIFRAQSNLSHFQKFINKITQQCKQQNIAIYASSKAKTKQMARAFYKAYYVYFQKDGFKQMTDVLRCSIVFETFDALYRTFVIIERLADQEVGGILRVKDRFHPKQIPFGYRDLLINIYCPNCKIVCEIQLHHKVFYNFKAISHSMYKKARLFEQNDTNLAYNYATKHIRPKIGTNEVYKDDGQNNTYGDEKDADNPELKNYETLLNEWGLGQFAAKMKDEGWDDVVDWKDLIEDDLRNDLGFSKGHSRKFLRKYKQYEKEIKEYKKKQQEEKQAIASVQQHIYGNIQPQMQLQQQQQYEKKDENMKCPRCVTNGYDNRLVYKTSKELIKNDAGYLNGFVCNKCKKSFSRTGSHNCKYCNYDLCHDCCQKVKNGDNVPPPPPYQSITKGSKNINWNKMEASHFDFLACLGEGTFAKVFHVKYKKDGKEFALKILSKHVQLTKENGRKQANSERFCLSKIHTHPNITSFYFAFQNERNLYLVLEYIPGGELFYHLKLKSKFSENIARFIVSEIIMAVGHLHKFNIIHRQIYPENILLRSNGHIVLCDFTLATQLGPSLQTHTFCGVPEYLAPEVIEGKSYGKPVDFWAIGTTLYELVFGLPPFYDQNVNQMYLNIKKEKLKFDKRDTNNKFGSKELKDFIKLLLNRNTSKRLGSKKGVSALQKHKLFKSLNWNKLLKQEYDAIFQPNTQNGNYCVDQEFLNKPAQDVNNQIPAEKSGFKMYEFNHQLSSF